MNLTERRIERLMVEGNQRDRLVFDDEQRGLAVRVTASGGRTYLCQYTLHGQKWRVPLGACSALSLAKARKAAEAIMGRVADGKNPAVERKEATAAERVKRARDRLTLRVLIEDWKRLHLAGRRPRYATEAVRALHHAFVHHLDAPAENLDRASVVRALDASTRSRKTAGPGSGAAKGSAMAARTAAYGRAAFAWAVKRGVVHVNPFAALPVTRSVAKRERVLSDGELADAWRAAGDEVFASSAYGAIVRLLILTGQRREEIAGMAWSELSEDLTTWTLPRERAKNNAPHIVPLSEAARQLIRGLLPEDENEAKRAMEQRRLEDALVLPGARATRFSGWSKSKRALDAAIANARAEAAAKLGTKPSPLAAWTLHDLRRTLATGLQRLGIRLEVTEAVLNHVSGSRAGIVGIYQRHDWAEEKRAALDSWAAHVLAVVEGRAGTANVLAFRKAG